MDKKYTRNPTDIKLCTSHQHFLFTVIVYSLTSIQEAREKRFQSFTGQLPRHSRRQRRQSNHSFVTEHIETTASASDHNIYEVSCPGWICLSARFFYVYYVFHTVTDTTHVSSALKSATRRPSKGNFAGPVTSLLLMLCILMQSLPGDVSLSLDKGDYPDILQVVFCSNK